MTNATANADGIGPFESRFQVGAAILAGVCFLVAIAVGWTGYQGESLLLVGTELNVVGGATGFVMGAALGLVSLVAAFYMEPGFDH